MLMLCKSSYARLTPEVLHQKTLDGASICPRKNLISGKNEIPAPSSAANMYQKLDLSLFCPSHGKLVYHAINFRQAYLRYCDGHIKVQGVMIGFKRTTF